MLRTAGLGQGRFAQWIKKSPRKTGARRVRTATPGAGLDSLLTLQRPALPPSLPSRNRRMTLLLQVPLTVFLFL